MDIKVRLSQKQTQAWQALSDPNVKDVLYGGAKGGGKSVFLCLWAYAYAEHIINRFKLTPTTRPIHIGWIGRKQAVDFTSTTMQTWKRFIPHQCYEIKGGTEKDPKHILIRGTVAIDFGGLDKQETINKFNSAEYGFVAVDQAEETERDDVSVLRASRRLKIDGQSLPYKGLFTANPAQCWLKEEFIDNIDSQYRYIPALPTDNPYLPAEYIQTLNQAFKHRPELLEAYLNGSWDTFEGHNQVIKNSWIAHARTLTHFPTHNKRFLVCDPARFGDDETVIYLFNNHKVEAEWLYGLKDTHYTSGFLNKLSLENGDITIVIDGDGLGAGIIDNLAAYGRTVIEHKGSNKALNDEKYYNKRAEAWDYTAKQFSDASIDFKSNDSQLVNQLCTPTYKFRNSRMLIEDKAEIKDRIGRSPDRGDCFVMGIYNSQFIEQTDDKDGSGLSGVPDFIKRW